MPVATATASPGRKKKQKPNYLDALDWDKQKAHTPTEALKDNLSDSWRWTDRKIKLSDRCGANIPTPMKEALRNAKAATSIPMSEFIRGYIGKGLRKRSKK